MTIVNLIKYAGNNKKNISTAAVGKVGITLPGNVGTMVSGDEYKIASVPANSLITAVHLIVKDVFNGTTPTLDVKIGSTVVHDDIDASAAGVTSDTTGRYVTTLTDITVIPTISSATTGTLEVVVEFTELDGYLGTFTE